MRVLVVEDEKKLAGLLKQGLEEEGCLVTAAHTGTDGLEFAQATRFDAIVLDVMLPGIDGFEVARRLRKANNRTPILVLTARDSVPDIVKGLDLGADDYLTKPFSFVEFVARLRAVSRRGPVPQTTQLQCADLKLDLSTCQVFRAGKPIPLTKKEYLLLELLLRNADRVVRRELILETIWGTQESVENNTVDAFIKLLRHKVDQDHPVKLIHTVRGFGYRLREGDD
ncbi:MAG: response regulator transcription factor [Bryobacteraceae bacterium]|jgi:DNA-binding response OmpR family regulator